MNDKKLNEEFDSTIELAIENLSQSLSEKINQYENSKFANSKIKDVFLTIQAILAVLAIDIVGKKLEKRVTDLTQNL